MGCCASHDNKILEFPYEKMEEYNNLKTEINEILSNKDNKDRKNFNKLMELFTRSSNKIAEYEREIKNLKNQQTKDPAFNSDMLKGFNEDIKQLKDYNQTLNNLIKECDENNIDIKNENENEISNHSDKKQDQIIENNIENKPKEAEEFNEGNNLIDSEKQENNINNDNNINKIDNINNYTEEEEKKNILKNVKNNIDEEYKNDFKEQEMQNDFRNELENETTQKENKKVEDINNNYQNEEINNNNSNNNNINNDNINDNINDDDNNVHTSEQIYYKKAIRRNKKSGIFNKKSVMSQEFQQNYINNYPEMDDFNENDNNNNHNLDEMNAINNENLIKIIFVLENGKEIEVQANKTDIFLDIIKKLGTVENSFNNMDNILLFDDKEDITDRVKNGECVDSFGFNDYHLIQVKFKLNN